MLRLEWSTSLCILGLTALLMQGDLNLNICEAHAFNTHDRFSLDVFVVNGWHGEVTTPPFRLWHHLLLLLYLG